jgi:hypothetical protein
MAAALSIASSHQAVPCGERTHNSCRGRSGNLLRHERAQPPTDRGMFLGKGEIFCREMLVRARRLYWEPAAPRIPLARHWPSRSACRGRTVDTNIREQGITSKARSDS